MTTTFTINESDWTTTFYSTYAQIKEDVKNGLKVKEIKQKYGITDGKWISYRNELIQDGIIPKGKGKKSKPKYYTKVGKKWIVQKTIHGSKRHFGTFYSEVEAQRCVELLKEVDWDTEQSWEIRAKVKKEFQE